MPNPTEPGATAVATPAVTGVRLEELRGWVEAHAKARGLSLSEVIRRAVRDYRAREEDAQR
jgi:hypothetical protein